MNKEVILGLARHVLTAAGGAVAAQGHIAADDVNVVVGALVALLGVLLSVIAKRKK